MRAIVTKRVGKSHRAIIILLIVSMLLTLSTSLVNAGDGSSHSLLSSSTQGDDPLFVEGERIVRDYLLSKGNRTVDTNSVQYRAFLIEVLNDLHPELFAKDKVTSVTHYVIVKLGLPSDKQTRTVNVKNPSLPFASKAAYVRNDAVNYANQWVTKNGQKRNPLYPDFQSGNGGGDCTNFISQAVKAGGITVVGDGTCRHESTTTEWYIKKLPSPCGLPGQSFRDWAWSTSWSAVKHFRYFMRDQKSAWVEAYPATKEGVSLLISRLQPGDIVQFDVRKCDTCAWTPSHSIIIVELKNNGSYYLNNALYNGHTSDANLNDSYKDSLRTKYTNWVGLGIAKLRRMVWIRP